MSANDFLQLPTGVIALILVMVWPALWAAGQMTVALAGDVIRQTKGARLAYDPMSIEGTTRMSIEDDQMTNIRSADMQRCIDECESCHEILRQVRDTA